MLTLRCQALGQIPLKAHLQVDNRPEDANSLSTPQLSASQTPGRCPSPHGNERTLQQKAAFPAYSGALPIATRQDLSLENSPPTQLRNNHNIGATLNRQPPIPIYSMASENNSIRMGINAPTPRPSHNTGGADNTSTRTAPGPPTTPIFTAPPIILLDALTVGEEGVHMKGAHYIPVLAILSRVPRGFELVVDSRLLPFSPGPRAQEHHLQYQLKLQQQQQQQQAQAQTYQQTPAFRAASAAPAADGGSQTRAPKPPPFSSENGQPQFLPQARREDQIQPQGVMGSVNRMGARGGLGAQLGVEAEQHSDEEDRTEAWVGAQAQTADPSSHEIFIELEDLR